MIVFQAVAVAERYLGMFRSIGIEVAPGLYVCTALSKGARDRIWDILEDWWKSMPGGSIVMISRDTLAPGGVSMRSLGIPKREWAELDGALVVFRKNST